MKKKIEMLLVGIFMVGRQINIDRTGAIID